MSLSGSLLSFFAFSTEKGVNQDLRSTVFLEPVLLSSEGDTGGQGSLEGISPTESAERGEFGCNKENGLFAFRRVVEGVL